MKVRNDFVTNSSSSSFIISKEGLTFDQIEAIENPRISIRKFENRFIKLTDGEYDKWVEQKCREREDGRIVVPGWAESVEDYISEAEGWWVSDYDESSITMYTYSDNFYFQDLLTLLGVPKSNYKEER